MPEQTPSLRSTIRPVSLTTGTLPTIQNINSSSWPTVR
jgi:hypothetical protein